MSSDGLNAFVSHSLFYADPLSNVFFFLFLLTESCFAASFLYVSVTGILPVLCVCIVLCADKCACKSLCLCMCGYFSRVELLLCQCQKWRMVLLVKDSLLCCTGLPTLFRRANCLYLMLDLCYLSIKTSHTFGTRWVISSIPACGHERKLSSLLLCHSILLLTCRQFLLPTAFEISIVVAHKVFIGWPFGQYSPWPSLLAPFQMLKCFCHHVTPKAVLYFIPTSFRLRVTLCPVFADWWPSWFVRFSHCPVIWVGSKSQSRWWHSLAFANHWWLHFPYHKASSKVQTPQSCFSLLDHCRHSSDLPQLASLTVIIFHKESCLSNYKLVFIPFVILFFIFYSFKYFKIIIIKQNRRTKNVFLFSFVFSTTLYLH